MPFLIQPSFTSGEISPSLYGRIDLAKYATALKTMYNFVCHAHGGASNRPGTAYIGVALDSDKAVRLIPFQYSVEQAYVLEFSDYIMRVIKDGGYVLKTSADAWDSSHGYLVNDFVENDSVIYRCTQAHTSGDTDDEPGVGAVWATYWVADDEYRITTPYSSSETIDLEYAQTADTMYISNPACFPQKLTRTDHDAWTMTDQAFVDGPYLPTDSSASDYTFTPSVRFKGDTGIMTASAAFFTSNMIGAPFRLGYEDPEDDANIDWGYVMITAYNSPTSVDIEVMEDLGYEYLLNGDFTAGVNNWEDSSTGTNEFFVVSNVAYLKNYDNYSKMQQAVPVPDGSNLTLTLTTGSKIAQTVTIRVGTTDLGWQVLDEPNQVLEPDTVYTWTFTATADLLYVNIRSGTTGTGRYRATDDNTHFDWVQSTADPNAWYLTNLGLEDPDIDYPPGIVYQNATTVMTVGTLGSLSAGQWAYGDIDSLGFSTIYIRLTAGGDPDLYGYDYVRCCDTDAVSISSESVEWYQSSGNTLEWYLQLAGGGNPSSIIGTNTALVCVDTDTRSLVEGTAGSLSVGQWDYNDNDTLGYNTIYIRMLDDSDPNSADIDSITKRAGTGTTTDFAIIKIAEMSVTLSSMQTEHWREAAFTDDYGYPSTVAFFEQRLIFGGTRSYPQTLWPSMTADYDNFGFHNPVQDADAFNITLDARQMNAIAWLIPLNQLLIGTAGTEWVVQAGSNSDAMTSASIQARVQSYNGSEDLQPFVINDTIVYLQRGAQIIRSFSPNEAGGFGGVNLSIMANHLFEGYSIVSWAYARKPNEILWCVRNDGILLGFTYMKEQEVWGWHRHETEGGTFESVAVIPGSEIDDVYVVVKRYIDGSYVRYIERFEERIADEDTYDYNFLDSSLTYTGDVLTQGTLGALALDEWAYGDNDSLGYSTIYVRLTADVDPGSLSTYLRAAMGTGYEMLGYGMTRWINSATTTEWYLVTLAGGDPGLDEPASIQYAATTISGLGHLEGETVTALADGSVIKGLTVSSGSVTIPYPSSLVRVGLGYDCVIETLDINFQDDFGTVQGRKKTIPSVVVRMHKTRGLWAGPDADSLNELTFTGPETGANPPELYTGDKQLRLQSQYNAHGRVYIQQSDPLPATVLGVIPDVEFSDL